ncbi:hypothetical protein N7488_006328 [Penicillium malachiteum]|nr:hypothetical protein N7488_006328 [Penicillium malachiteum]
MESDKILVATEAAFSLVDVNDEATSLADTNEAVKPSQLSAMAKRNGRKAKGKYGLSPLLSEEPVSDEATPIEEAVPVKEATLIKEQSVRNSHC